MQRDCKGRFVKMVREKRKCLICGKEFEIIRSRFSNRKYCSRSCYYSSMKGKVIKICKYCGKKFSIIPYKLKIGEGIYCSPKCYQLASRKRITKICPVCQKIFTTFPLTNKEYCSKECYGLSRRKRIEKICPICNKKFETLHSNSSKYCSSKCFHIGNKGHIAWSKGLKRPEHSKKMKGEKNPNWQGGICFEPYSYNFNDQLKELIRNRDGYICQLCGIPEIEECQKLSIHHINYNKKDCQPNNLISLCNRCNAKVNKSRDEWKIYFDKKIKEIMDRNKMQLGSTSKMKEEKNGPDKSINFNLLLEKR